MKRCETKLVLKRTIIEDNNTKTKLPDIYTEVTITRKNYEDAKRLNVDLDPEIIRHMYTELCKKIINEKIF